jgi:hypothetical protein
VWTQLVVCGDSTMLQLKTVCQLLLWLHRVTTAVTAVAAVGRYLALYIKRQRLIYCGC